MQFTWKQKMRYVLLGVTILTITALSIRQTVHAFLKNTQHKKELTLAQSAPQQIKSYQKTLTSLKANTSTTTNKDQLFQVVSNFAAKHQLTIKSLGEPDIKTSDNHTIETHQIKVQGRFKDITKLIYELEQKQRIGNVVSTSFQTKKVRRLKKTRLTATIVVQHIHPITTNYS